MKKKKKKKVCVGVSNQPKRGIASQVLLRRGQRHSKAKLDIAIVNKWNGKGGEGWGGGGVELYQNPILCKFESQIERKNQHLFHSQVTSTRTNSLSLSCKISVFLFFCNNFSIFLFDDLWTFYLFLFIYLLSSYLFYQSLFLFVSYSDFPRSLSIFNTTHLASFVSLSDNTSPPAL